ncbi:sigma-70 family RNA polymerase sigma factor [Fontisubflavum oceani]|uniref:sigma-70 family RNA polymerase sigma factor n=1 Tax=Fontisubflavum oceani TaxID=2978973 RepID=UPI0025B4B5FF|nr:sigma-70 family RNA polymerase sigma factor [Fontisubflavum oceani]WJY22988.1 sigma-70 family RNA polymerase sigma factor [Fontisubflavum oceani]
MNKPVPNFGRHARRRRSADMLSAEEERHLVRAWQDRGDRRARDKLIHAFAPLAASIAKRFMRGSGQADPDLIQQANIGLMKAADRFDVDRENRFASYAIWWIRAEIQDYARANKSIVKRPNSAQTRKAAAQIAALEAEMATGLRISRAEADKRLAEALGIDIERVAELRAQISGRDHSLNAPALGDDGEDRIALLVDPDSLEDPAPLRKLEATALRRALVDALSGLPDRERDIVVATQLHDPPATLECLGAQYGVSRERIRQLRERGFERLRESMYLRNFGPEYFT